MSRWLPCRRTVSIRRLGKLGFDGPYSGARHQFMIYEQYRMTVPSSGEYSVGQLRMLLHEVEEMIGRPISTDQWNRL